MKLLEHPWPKCEFQAVIFFFGGGGGGRGEGWWWWWWWWGLWRAKFSILCDVIFLVRLQGKCAMDQLWEWKGKDCNIWRFATSDDYNEIKRCYSILRCKAKFQSYSTLRVDKSIVMMSSFWGTVLGAVLNRVLGRGVRPTWRNPDPVQDTQDVNFLPSLRESAVISYPVQDWTKQAVFKTLKTVHTSLCFHAFQQRHTKSVKIMWWKGKKRRRFVGTTLFKTRKCEIVYPV